MKTVYAISKDDKFLNNAGYFDDLTSQIKLFESIEDANRYSMGNLTTHPYEISEVHIITGKRYANSLYNIQSKREHILGY